jgi:sugar/nucleoside kinase (ribokinase family)
MDVFAIGTPVVDYFARADEKYLAKQKLTSGATNFVSRKKLDAMQKALGKSIFHVGAGDNARNVCEGVCRLGGSAVYAGMIGKDEEGKEFAHSLKSNFVQNRLALGEGRTGKIVCLITDDGQRTFAADLGNGLNFAEFGDEEAVADSGFFYLTSITLSGKTKVAKLASGLMGIAKREGCKIALSLESPPLVKRNRKMLLGAAKKCDLLFLNEEELEAFCGESDESRQYLFLQKNLPYAAVFVKRGENGSAVLCGGELLTIPAYHASVLDTTGAGDSYAAGVIYGLSQGHNCERAGKLGAHLASLVIGKYGAGMPKEISRLVV